MSNKTCGGEERRCCCLTCEYLRRSEPEAHGYVGCAYMDLMTPCLPGTTRDHVMGVGLMLMVEVGQAILDRDGCVHWRQAMLWQGRQFRRVTGAPETAKAFSMRLARAKRKGAGAKGTKTEGGHGRT